MRTAKIKLVLLNSIDKIIYNANRINNNLGYIGSHTSWLKCIGVHSYKCIVNDNKIIIEARKTIISCWNPLKM